MVGTCCVHGCSSKRSKDMRLHRVKANPEMRRKWLTLVGREDLIEDDTKKNLLICDKHFSDRQKYSANARNRTNLLADAFPDTDLPPKSFRNASEVLSTKESINQPSHVLLQDFVFVDCDAQPDEACGKDRMSFLEE